ncbi:bifunctional diguanylate cyclase/phosphodiesterase [Actinoplanes oblitus]|uniref:Bifunctional diguanylate cyclase/phosphodiesterase n=1 Tax=Actinoplanes oblitus TaxID=3040509 RepID=A0ABY8W7S8_9ACTN|nr:bifunctional diguanylate cyclase/phosphodiesterase [Actinoplanes oblitus]WIM93926.1 bifunctional diguanylate cyclase/phosphodiesterase [Actinoplanes oblitus]
MTRPGRHAAVTGATALLGVLWFAGWSITRIGPATVCYVFMPVGLLAAGLALRALRRDVRPAPAGRRFWLLLETAGWLMAAGYAWLGLAGVAAYPAMPAMPVGASVLIGLGQLAAMAAVATVPLGVTGWAQRGRQWLDRAIAFLGCAAVLWHFGIFPMLTLSHPWSPGVLATVLGGFLFAAGAVTKVSYLPGGPLDRLAVRLVAGTGLVAAAFAVLAVLRPGDAAISAQSVLLPIVPLLIALAALRQRHATAGPPARADSWLPYLAMVAADVPLAHVLFGTTTLGDGIHEVRIVAGVAALVATLVSVRQWVVNRDNTRLLREREASEARLQYEATHDALTGLGNRALFRERLNAALATTGATVLLVDLDDFNTVNDSLGHDVGDELLVAFADTLRRAIGDDGVPARLAGDEFAVLITTPGGDAAVAERIMTAIAVPISAHRLLVQASAGSATAPAGARASQVLRDADAAMHTAKQRGKANWVRYAAGMEKPAQAAAQLGGDLRRALDAGEFSLVYQPIVSLVDGRTIGVEALVRWNHPERGMVSPADFIPAAERTGLIVPLGRWVLRETCRQAAAWIAEFGPDVLWKAAPNVSVRQLHDPDFVADVRAALADSGLPADRLVLELTESAVLRGHQVLKVLHELHDMGVRLALDDFGTGESSLSLLRAFPAAVVKLDKSFVDNIELDEEGSAAANARQAVARAVVQLADALGLDTVAEGIENQEQADRLRKLGYTVGQGYFLGRPVDAAAFTARLVAQRKLTAA